MDSRFDDRLERDDDRKEDFKLEDILDTYKLGLEYYGKSDTSREFDEKIENIGALLRKSGIILERENISREEKEKTVDKEEMEKTLEIQRQVIDDCKFSELPQDIDSCVAILDIKVQIGDEITTVRDLFDEKDIQLSHHMKLTEIDKEISNDITLRELIGEDCRFIPESRDEYIDRYCNINALVKDHFFKEFSDARQVSLKRDREESFIDKLSRLYDEKELHNPTLHYALSRCDELKDIVELRYTDSTAFNAMSAFILSLSSEEKRFLLPATIEESRELTENIHSSILKDEILRPITGYANLNGKMLDKMAEALDGKKCLEIMAGNGLLSRELQDRGVDVLATDKYTISENGYYALRGVDTHTQIEYLDALDAVNKYAADVDVIIMSWPPYNNRISSDVIDALHEINPDIDILYIGESQGGCTADDLFFEKTYEDYFDLSYDIDDTHVNYSELYDKVEFRKITNE